MCFLVYRLRLRQMRMRFHVVNEEWARLAREMHDTVIQGCTGVSTLLEAALGVETSEEPLRHQFISYATDQVRATIEAAREAVWALRSTSTSAADAGSLCKNPARQFQSDSGIPVGCRMTGLPFELGELATHELMMIVREALTNAIALGNPKSINMDVCFAEHDLKIEVRDDGYGFDPSAALSRNGHLWSPRNAGTSRLLGGNLDIESNPGHGTTVRISVPRKRRVMERMVTGNASQGPHEVEGLDIWWEKDRRLMLQSINAQDPAIFEQALRNYHDPVVAAGGILIQPVLDFKDPGKQRLAEGLLATSGDLPCYCGSGQAIIRPASGISDILKLKAHHPALYQNSVRRCIATNHDKNLYATLRYAADKSERILVIFNFFSQSIAAEVDTGAINGSRYRDLESGEMAVVSSGTLSFELTGYGHRIFRIDP